MLQQRIHRLVSPGMRPGVADLQIRKQSMLFSAVLFLDRAQGAPMPEDSDETAPSEIPAEQGA